MAHLDDFEIAEYFGSSCAASLRARVLDEIARCEACRRLVVELARGHGSPLASDPLQRYAFRAHLGSGAWGVVHRAHDRVLKRDVAIKLVLDAKAQLAREGRLLARCHHPNVVKLFDVVALGDDVALIMELLGGGTLEAWLATQPSAASILDRFRDAGRGLAAAHRAGVVHGDFKARNVLLDEGRVVVADFGLGHVEHRVETQEQLGSLVEPTWGGTPGFLAPERVGGAPASAGADQYAFGTALKRALETPARGVRAALSRMTDPEPSARFESMDEAVDALSKPALRPLGLLGLAGAALAAVAIVPTLRAEPPLEPPQPAPRAYDPDDPQRHALDVASELLRSQEYAAALATLEEAFDLSEPHEGRGWARAANLASKVHGANQDLEAQYRLAAWAADVAVEVGHDGLAAEATLTMLQARLEQGYTPELRSLLRRAAAHSDRALAEPGDDVLDQRIDLRVQLARAAMLAGDRDLDGSLRTVDAAIDRAHESLGPDAYALAGLYAFRSKLRRHLGDTDGAGADARATIRVIEHTRSPHSWELAEPLQALMHLAAAEGEHPRALEYADRSVAVLGEGPTLSLARALKNRGGMHAIVRNFTEAEADLERARAIFENQGSALDRCDTALNLARVRGWQGRVDDALVLFERAQVLAEEAGRADIIARIDLERCRVFADAQQPSRALEACSAAEVAFVELFGPDHPAATELADLRRALPARRREGRWPDAAPGGASGARPTPSTPPAPSGPP